MQTDEAVLREMVRIAEGRRAEILLMMEKINQYNLALIAFSGSFLSLLVSVQFPKWIVGVSGIFLLGSIISSLCAIWPKPMKRGSLLIEKDIANIRMGKAPALLQFLLETAELTEFAANNAKAITSFKKKWTICSAFFLAIALLTTYTLYIMMPSLGDLLTGI